MKWLLFLLLTVLISCKQNTVNNTIVYPALRGIVVHRVKGDKRLEEFLQYVKDNGICWKVEVLVSSPDYVDTLSSYTVILECRESE